ncbi:Protein CBG26112 [Caenorhabditis briggsae]|uniref:Protein CBG26112 n=1 Tax=Caenorhabditis briggsae TaxID=6238 RepID=B6IM28_CAEBR|nr:Protein CBG26112 [Caenorhabditis briggsae]CAS00958.1 Protein CBG26112 [Caenorhabditis briggsae]
MASIVALGSSFSFGFQLLITNPAQGSFIKKFQFLNASKHSNDPDDAIIAHLKNQSSAEKNNSEKLERNSR